MFTSQRIVAGFSLCVCLSSAATDAVAQRPMVRGVRHASAYSTSPGGVRQAAAQQSYQSAAAASGYAAQPMSPYGGYPAASYGEPVSYQAYSSERPYPREDASCFLCRPRPVIHRPGWHPTHQHFSIYDDPGNVMSGGGMGSGRGLVYPPANVPAAAVQYPYYTLKGPDDFFLK